jgi:hypothetical protein
VLDDGNGDRVDAGRVAHVRSHAEARCSASLFDHWPGQVNCRIGAGEASRAFAGSFLSIDGQRHQLLLMIAFRIKISENVTF